MYGHQKCMNHKKWVIRSIVAKNCLSTLAVFNNGIWLTGDFSTVFILDLNFIVFYSCTWIDKIRSNLNENIKRGSKFFHRLTVIKQKDYIDVGDGCWIEVMLVTNFHCGWPSCHRSRKSQNGEFHKLMVHDELMCSCKGPLERPWTFQLHDLSNCPFQVYGM